MSSYEITENDIQAYIDKQLDENKVLRVEAFLHSQPEEQSRVGQYRQMINPQHNLCMKIVAKNV